MDPSVITYLPVVDAIYNAAKSFSLLVAVK